MKLWFIIFFIAFQNSSYGQDVKGLLKYLNSLIYVSDINTRQIKEHREKPFIVAKEIDTGETSKGLLLEFKNIYFKNANWTRFDVDYAHQRIYHKRVFFIYRTQEQMEADFEYTIKQLKKEFNYSQIFYSMQSNSPSGTQTDSTAQSTKAKSRKRTVSMMRFGYNKYTYYKYYIEVQKEPERNTLVITLKDYRGYYHTSGQ